jgi:hypothetical protein
MYIYIYIYNCANIFNLCIYIASLKIAQISVLLINALFKFLAAFEIMNLFKTKLCKLHCPCLYINQHEVGFN